jgi:hypothetical protein
MEFTCCQRSVPAAGGAVPDCTARIGPRRHTVSWVTQMMNTDAAEFEVRWANWIERGRVHEQRARRRFAIGAAVVMAVITVAYLIVH